MGITRRAPRRGVGAAVVLLTLLLGLLTGMNPGLARAATGEMTTTPVGIAAAVDGRGYWVTSRAGEVRAFGSARDLGDLPTLNVRVGNVAGISPTPSGSGYWLVASDGGVFSFGDASFHGSMGGKPLNRPVVGMAPTPSGRGYWLVASDGGIFAFGDASFYGSMGGRQLNKPVVGIAATASGRGYWLVASDGGVFAFGDAQFHGSLGGQALNAPIAGIARVPDGSGYWMVASDGGIFAFGAAGFFRSLGGVSLAAPVTGMTPTPSGRGYWLAAQDGGVFSFGDAQFHGRPSVQGRTVPTGRRLPADLRISAAAAIFISRYEGFVATPQPDPVGHCTVGFGHKLHDGACTAADRSQWGTVTRDEAMGLLQQDAERLVNGIRGRIARTPLSQHEFDALASWTFNHGPGQFPGTGLERQLLATPPAYGNVPGELMKWVRAGSTPLCGLYRRRISEGRIWTSADYSLSTAPCPPGYR